MIARRAATWLLLTLVVVVGVGCHVALPVPGPGVAATPTPIRGIGVSRAQIQSDYEHPVISFEFDPPTNVRGEQRVEGKSKDGLTKLKLVGPPDDLHRAMMTW